MIYQLLTVGALLTVVHNGHAQQAAGSANRLAGGISQNAFESHFHFLSDDLLEGRRPGTRGGRLAADYIADQFERMGLTPAGADSGWFQPFDLTESRIVRSDLTAGGEVFAQGTDQVLIATGSDTTISYRGQIVFVGYGLVAPEYAWDDYKDVDVRGKLVIALAGHPGEVDRTIFTAPGDYGTRSVKTLEAMRHGAVGALVIHRPVETGFDWNRVARSWFRESISLARPDSAIVPPGLSGWVRDSAAARLLRLGGLDLGTLIAQSRSRSFRPVPVAIEVRAGTATSHRTLHARNVMGLWPGRGVNAGEAVVLGGHYDHLGIGAPVAGDSIYNGAEDNAAGIAGLLTVAEAFAGSGVTGGRSILFIAFDAEEVGLLGSRTYVESPAVPLARTAAMLNLDGMNVYARTTDTWALGLEYSGLESVFRAAARAEGIAVEIGTAERKFLEDEHFFTRSDHYNFARAGVPSLFVLGGFTAVGKPAGWMQQKLEEYLNTRYHRPGDEIQSWYSSEGGRIDLRILARTLYAVSRSPGFPAWKPDSPYQRTRRGEQ